MDRLGRWVAHHPVSVLLTWAVVVVTGFLLASGAVGEGLFGRLTSGEPDVPGESRTGRGLLVDAAPRGDSISMIVDGVDLADPAVVQKVGAAREDLRLIRFVTEVADPYAFPTPEAPDPADPRGAVLVSQDRDGFLVTVTFDPTVAGEQRDDALDSTRARLRVLGEEVQAVEPGATRAGRRPHRAGRRHQPPGRAGPAHR